MTGATPLARLVRGALLTIVGLFFLFPIVWVFLMSFQTNATILRIPPSLLFSPTLDNYVALISGRLEMTDWSSASGVTARAPVPAGSPPRPGRCRETARDRARPRARKGRAAGSPPARAR